jgi:Holliday junction DNA helicase RuvA
LALTILSGIEADQFVSCVHHNDTAALVKLPGVGKKTAERLLVEMRDRLADWDMSGSASTGGVAAVAGRQQSHIMDEAESAMLALGYKPQQASKAIAGIPEADYNSAEELIRQALKGMVKS